MATGNRSQGCYLGDREEAGRLVSTYIPLPDRDLHTCIFGSPGQEMSALLLRIIIGDILRGERYAILDSFGNLSDRLLDLIPSEHAARNWIPMLHPLAKVDVALPNAADDVLTRAVLGGGEKWGEAHEFESAKDQISSKWADPSDDCYSRETAAEDRRAAILETLYGNGDWDT